MLGIGVTAEKETHREDCHCSKVDRSFSRTTTSSFDGFFKWDHHEDTQLPLLWRDWTPTPSSYLISILCRQHRWFLILKIFSTGEQVFLCKRPAFTHSIISKGQEIRRRYLRRSVSLHGIWARNGYLCRFKSHPVWPKSFIFYLSSGLPKYIHSIFVRFYLQSNLIYIFNAVVDGDLYYLYYEHSVGVDFDNIIYGKVFSYCILY